MKLNIDKKKLYIRRHNFLCIILFSNLRAKIGLWITIGHDVQEQEAYTPETYEAYRSAVKAAESVLNDVNATGDDVNGSLENMENGILALIVKPDKTNLSALVKSASALDEEKYTTATYKVLKTKLESATYVVNNEEATQENVDSALASLNEGMAQLVKATKGIYKISINYSRTYNNHVGNSWSKYCTYNGEDFSSGNQITATPNSSVSLYFKIVENDTIPDVGSGTVYIRLKDGEEASTNIVVRENRGRYSGNTAQWVVTCTVTCLEIL